MSVYILERFSRAGSHEDGLLNDLKLSKFGGIFFLPKIKGFSSVKRK